MLSSEVYTHTHAHTCTHTRSRIVTTGEDQSRGRQEVVAEVVLAHCNGALVLADRWLQIRVNERTIKRSL